MTAGCCVYCRGSQDPAAYHEAEARRIRSEVFTTNSPAIRALLEERSTQEETLAKRLRGTA